MQSTIHKGREAKPHTLKRPPFAQTPAALAVASALLLASPGAFAQCASGGTVDIITDCTGNITASNLTVTATGNIPNPHSNNWGTTVTGDVTGAGAFADNVLTLQHAATNNASQRRYARIDGDVTNFGTINLIYSAPGSINQGAYNTPFTIGLGDIDTGADANAAVKLYIEANHTTNGGSYNRHFKLTSDLKGDGGLDVTLGTGGNTAGTNSTLILAGMNNSAYTGLTTVRIGTLQIGDGTFAAGEEGTMGTAPSTFSFNEGNDIHLVGDHAAVRFALPNSVTNFLYNGQITSEGNVSGTGAGQFVFIAGAGTMTLLQNQTYTGMTLVGGTAGAGATTLIIGDGATDGSTGTGTLKIGVTGTVILNRTDDLTWTHRLSVDGTFQKQNANTLIVGNFSLNNNANAIIDDGTLQIGTGALGSSIMSGHFNMVASTAELVIDYDVDSNGSPVTFGDYNHSTSSNYTTSGAGTLIKNGSSTMIAQGWFGHTGGTTINEGTLQLGNGTSRAYGSLGVVTLNNGATLDINAFTGSSGGTGFTSLIGDGNLKLSSSFALAADTPLGHTGTTEITSGNFTISGTTSLASSSALILRDNTTFTDNTTTGGQNLQRLDVYGSPTYQGSAGTFHADRINFVIPPTYTTSDTLLTLNNIDANIAGSTITVVVDGNGSPLTVGSSLDLFKLTGTSTVTGDPANTSTLGLYGAVAGATQGSLIGYSFDLEKSGNNLKAIVSGVQIREEAKSLSEGHLSGTAALTRSSDFIASHGIAAARAQLSKTYGTDDDGKDLPEKGLWGTGIQPFHAHSGGRMRHETGSHVNTQGYNFIAGAVAGFRTAAGEAMAGAFIEYGKAEYDTYNSFASGKVVGDGNTHHRGFGLFGRVDVKDGYYVEGSVRRGKVDTKYQSDSLRDFFGTRAGYTSDTAYSGAHVGAGKVWQLKGISDKLSLDTYAQALWTRQDGDTVRISTGERVAFSSISSERLKVGARARYDFTSRAAGYVGFAYDHEFGAEARAKLPDYNNAKIDTPKLSGGTGMVEVGFLVTPNADSPYSADIGIQGYTGKREGVVGSVRFNYYF
jgi:hypothetical protein